MSQEIENMWHLNINMCYLYNSSVPHEARDRGRVSLN